MMYTFAWLVHNMMLHDPKILLRIIDFVKHMVLQISVEYLTIEAQEENKCVDIFSKIFMFILSSL